MARLIVQTDLTGTITRQTLFDLYADASLNIGLEDVEGTDFGIQYASAISEAPVGVTPGTLIWNQGEQLMHVWTDELDGTGVSLWMAFGPDVFECACLAAEPIPAGAVVEIVYDRWVQVASPDAPANTSVDEFSPIGINQSGLPSVGDPYVEGDTAASGTWIRVAIDGLPRAWFPSADAGVSETRFGTTRAAGAGPFWVGCMVDDNAGGVGRINDNGLRCDGMIGASVQLVTHYSGMNQVYARVKWGGYRSSV